MSLDIVGRLCPICNTMVADDYFLWAVDKPYMNLYCHVVCFFNTSIEEKTDILKEILKER